MVEGALVVVVLNVVVVVVVVDVDGGLFGTLISSHPVSLTWSQSVSVVHPFGEPDCGQKIRS